MEEAIEIGYKETILNISNISLLVKGSESINDKTINREYFLYSVIRKMDSHQKNVFKIYRNLCEEFGSPPEQIDYNVLWNNIASYLQKTHYYEMDFDEYNRLTEKYPSKKFSQMRGLRTLFHRSQKIPKKYTEKQIEELIITSFLKMQLL